MNLIIDLSSARHRLRNCLIMADFPCPDTPANRTALFSITDEEACIRQPLFLNKQAAKLFFTAKFSIPKCLNEDGKKILVRFSPINSNLISLILVESKSSTVTLKSGLGDPFFKNPAYFCWQKTAQLSFDNSSLKFSPAIFNVKNFT